MCYGNGCSFQHGHTGECKVDISGITEHYGYSPCMIASIAECEEQEAFIQEHADEFDAMYKEIVTNRDFC